MRSMPVLSIIASITAKSLTCNQLAGRTRKKVALGDFFIAYTVISELMMAKTDPRHERFLSYVP